LELPVKIVFPRNLLGSVVPGQSASDFMMLGLGDMVSHSYPLRYITI
jgi:signal peptide peptidase-like protein 3